MPVRPRAYVALSVVAAVGALFGVQGIAPAMPALGRDLGVSDAQLGLFTAAYMLPAVIFALPLGYFADRYGRRRVFVASVLAYSLAGGAQALLSDYWTLLALRFVQGIGFGALMPLSMTMIGDVLRGTAQLRAQSRRQIAMSAGEFALPLVGAALASISWRAALGAQAALLPLAFVGAALLAGMKTPPMQERYARELSEAVAQPGMPGVLIAGFLRFVCKFALIAYLPVLLVGSRGASLAEAALVLSVASGVAALTNFAIVALMRRVAASALLSVAVVLIGGAMAGFALAGSWQVALLVAVVFGLGDGMLTVVQNALVTEAAPDRVRAGLVAVSATTRNAGKLVAPLAIGALSLAVPVSLAFGLVGAAVVATIPALRQVRALDGLLTDRRNSEAIFSYPISE
ncbi:MAG TPA: MFS transporter [Solirubrobacter sp.]|nr:MFS transporter [Solirubrobacter sp.]